MEHTKGLQLHNKAIWDARHLPTIRPLMQCYSLDYNNEILEIYSSIISQYQELNLNRLLCYFNNNLMLNSANSLATPLLIKIYITGIFF